MCKSCKKYKDEISRLKKHLEAEREAVNSYHKMLLECQIEKNRLIDSLNVEKKTTTYLEHELRESRFKLEKLTELTGV